MGADVLDENNTVVGIAGQGANLPPHRTDKGHLSVRWGEGANDSCQLPFDISGKDSNSPIIRLNETCQS